VQVAQPAASSLDTGSAPRWFSAALVERPVHEVVEVDGCDVHVRRWGATELPGLVLVHGGGAHSGWWDHVAPFFAETHNVVALDLSGHGDSGRRERYDMTQWAREVVAVAAFAGIARPPVVVGHSMGGWVAATTGADHGEQVAGVVIIDSPLNDQPPEEAALQQRRRPTRVYTSIEEAVQRFTTIPRQQVLLPYVADHIARQSLRPVEGGWTWKFDPTLFGQRRLMRDLLPELRCRGAVFRAEFGLVSAAMAAEMQGLLQVPVPVIELPDAGHHPMLDQPLPLVAALRTLLTSWAADQGAR
jgi:pimeloyl-ACP methyl ester carboxylesterase